LNFLCAGKPQQFLSISDYNRKQHIEGVSAHASDGINRRTSMFSGLFLEHFLTLIASGRKFQILT